MQIRENRDFDTCPDRIEFDASTEKTGWAITSTNADEIAFEDFLDIELEPGQSGLQVLRIGEKSPLCRLRPLGSYAMQGLIESGDRIVAIDGILSRKLSDLIRIVSSRPFCEIAIFDHRTRLTVTWKIHLSNMLDAA